ncbi:MAG: YidB family protein [Candidatus Sedimenticola sp. (ex Thyasira tokunagai)]
MDINQILKLGAQAFMKSQGSGDAGGNLNPDILTTALSGLSGGKRGLDIASLIGGMQGGGMGDMLQSWLGDGQNQAISGSQVSNLLGSDKIRAFASQLGLSEEEAIGGLQDAMPQIVDKASSGGSLLDSIGGVGGALGLVSKLFGK